MLNCQWAHALTHYDCRSVPGVHSGEALEIGTPFSLGDGSAIVLYAVDKGSHVMFSDNGDTLAQLSGMGLDVWNPARLRALRERLSPHGVTLDSAGDLRCLAKPEHAPYVFARAITGMLAVADWASILLRQEVAEHDLPAEAEPYILARNPEARFERRKPVQGASRVEYHFDFLHGEDLIDVIAPSPQGTGGVMRKAGDVLNSPFVEGMSPLIIVDDRDNKEAADREIKIIGSIARAMHFTRLMSPNAIH